MNRTRLWSCIAVCLTIPLVTVPCPADEKQDADFFVTKVWPIFARRCITCHGGVKPKAGVSFVYPETVLPPGKSVVVPGKPDDSELIRRVSSSDASYRMPPADHGEGLSAGEIGVLREWVERGAPWPQHWAFRPASLSVPHRPEHGNWCRGGLDCWIFEHIRSAGAYPSAEETPVRWLRRASFDLTGLPPDEDLISELVHSDRPDARERVVDRLLASPAFGERWASVWLDLARYADSQGYEADNLRTMWPYRDWVIRAFNADVPFDAFTIKQLAGDMLPDRTLDDEIATAFHRNTPTNSEGGTDDEEFRTVAVIDRVNTTWEVWMGLTFKCVQCHNHPYLPIEHREYYRFLALFNTTRDWDLPNEKPLLRVPLDRHQFERARQLDAEREELEQSLVRETRRRTEQSPWYYLEPVYADSTYLTELVIRHADGIPEIHTAGTVSHDSKFTLVFDVPERLRRITAFCVEVLPRDPAKAVHTPELGFVISEIKGWVIEADDDPAAAKGRPISFRWALGDETLPFGDPMASLKPDKPGWGAKPRLTHPRRLVLVPDQPLTLNPKQRIKLVIRQEDAPRGYSPLVMNRSRYAVTDDPSWTSWTGSDRFVKLMQRLSQIRSQRAKIAGVNLPVMREQDPWLRRVTAVFRRGNWMDKTDPVEPGLPRFLGTRTRVRDRLALARWLVGPENPLTARVVVNRFWQELFGEGLVSTPDDFGPMAPYPTSRGALDYLAVRFVDGHGWSVKRLLREIVLSATYRQQNAVSPDAPDAPMLARGPRQRLAAEMLRDNALSVAGLLSRKMFGPPVMPPQPPGIWRAARSSLRWKTSEGEDRYRRGVYVIWRRTSPYPSFMIFDAPQRVVCSSRRVVTNTPLQALVCLNDEAYVECAKALAERVRHELPEADPKQWIARMYALAVGSTPDEPTLAVLEDVYRYALVEYQADPSLARATGLPADRAALALVANTILNLDPVLNR